MTLTTPAQLADLLATTTAVLLDFDGPVCSVFAGYPATEVAQQLRQLLNHHGHQLPDDVTATADPLHVIHRTADLAPDLATQIEAALTAAELHAVASAAPTPGAAELLAACSAIQRPVAVVSNNSAPAVEAYLHQHGLRAHVRHIQGRPADPTLMKPHPYPLHQALAALNVDPAAAVLIGDSRTDIDAARAAGTRVIAYANKPHKVDQFADADAVLTSMEPLAGAFAR